jgi:hypothetical protein
LGGRTINDDGAAASSAAKANDLTRDQLFGDVEFGGAIGTIGIDHVFVANGRLERGGGGANRAARSSEVNRQIVPKNS